MESLINTTIYNKYEILFGELIELIRETNKRVIREDSDDLFVDNLNFFNKSFMVVTCTYLEAYLKEVVYFCIESINSNLKTSPVARNLVYWSVMKNKDKDKDRCFEDFKLEIYQDDIDSEISGNVGKTIDLFSKLGINLNIEEEFRNHKDSIAGIVTKRNNIVHHNDDASDVSLNDVISYINSIKSYLAYIDKQVITYLGL